MIICQNENGPCPLIGIANVLLLRGDLSLSLDLSFISLDRLVELVGNQVFAFFEKSSHRLSPENMTAILNVLPTLAQGLDVNVSFNGVDKMEFTEQIALFDALNIPLLHGWIYDMHDVELAEVIGSLSYNHLVYTLVEYQSLIDKIQKQMRIKAQEEISASMSDKDRKLLRDGRIIDRFMKQSASQLTDHGLFKLHDFLRDRQLFVFFRNNHFSTIFYHQNQLFVLMTDLGYHDQPHVVWELLESVSGRWESSINEFFLIYFIYLIYFFHFFFCFVRSGAEFFNGEFIPLRELPPAALSSATPTAPTQSPIPPIGTVASAPSPLVSKNAQLPSNIKSPGAIQDETQNPMLSGNQGSYDPDYEMAMRLHLQENSDSANTSPHPVNVIRPAAIVMTQSGPVSMTAEQFQYFQQQQQEQQLMQQQYLQQQSHLNQQQYIQSVQSSLPPGPQMLKGVPVETLSPPQTTPPPPSNDEDVVVDYPELGMSQEELDRHTAMMLQFEEDNKAAKNRRKYEKRIRLRNRFLGIDENTGLDDAGYGGERSTCSIM